MLISAALFAYGNASDFSDFPPIFNDGVGRVLVLIVFFATLIWHFSVIHNENERLKNGEAIRSLKIEVERCENPFFKKDKKGRLTNTLTVCVTNNMNGTLFDLYVKPASARVGKAMIPTIYTNARVAWHDDSFVFPRLDPGQSALLKVAAQQSGRALFGVLAYNVVESGVYTVDYRVFGRMDGEAGYRQYKFRETIRFDTKTKQLSFVRKK